MESDLIAHLLIKYVNGTCSPEELSKIVQIINTQKGKNIFNKVDQVLWEKYYREPQFQNNADKIDREIRLILNSARKNKQIKPKRGWFINNQIKRIAAIFIIAVLFSWVFERILTNKTNDKKDTIEYIEKIAGYGFKNNVRLQDGSSILLNSKSKLTIPADYSALERNVHLEGEAFFSIAKDSIHPFHVETQDLKITVLGTSFNVRSLENESTACVTVATGKVFVTTHKGNEKIFLTPNKQLILNKITGKYKVNELKVLSDLDWKEDIMRANKTPIEEFVKKIESYYNIEVRLQGTKIKDITLSGVHQNKSLWSVLESLKYATGISYKQEGKTIILYK